MRQPIKSRTLCQVNDAELLETSRTNFGTRPEAASTYTPSALDAQTTHDPYDR